MKKDKKDRITIFLDCSVIEHFKEEAKIPGNAKYQTLINQVLLDYIRVMRGESTSENEQYIKHLDLKQYVKKSDLDNLVEKKVRKIFNELLKNC